MHRAQQHPVFSPNPQRGAGLPVQSLLVPPGDALGSGLPPACHFPCCKGKSELEEITPPPRPSLPAQPGERREFVASPPCPAEGWAPHRRPPLNMPLAGLARRTKRRDGAAAVPTACCGTWSTEEGCTPPPCRVSAPRSQGLRGEGDGEARGKPFPLPTSHRQLCLPLEGEREWKTSP